MRRMMLMVTVLVVGLLTLASPGMAYKRVKCFILQPPEQTLGGVKRIAIMDFEGKVGRSLSDYLISRLLDEDRGIHAIEGGFFKLKQEGRTFQKGATTKVFEMVERSRLAQVMTEQKLGLTGVIDETQAASLGKILGVDAIILGSASYESSDNWTKEERTAYKDKQKYTYTVDCLTRKVTAKARMRIVNVETAAIMGNRESNPVSEEKKCGDETKDMPSVDSMADGCLRSASWELANYCAPVFSLVEMELSKVKAKEYADKAEEAAKAAEKGTLDHAYLLYYTLYQQDTYNPEILYNLGILNEAVGNYSDAKEMYSSALSLKPGEGDYQTAVRRIEKALAYAGALEALGAAIVKHEWNTSEAAMSAATAEKVKVKGGSDERQEVKQEPNTNSLVVAKVPGGVELVVVAREGDWFKVKLIGGKEGYLHVSQVKE